MQLQIIIPLIQNKNSLFLALLYFIQTKMIYMRNRDFKTQKKQNTESRNIVTNLMKKLQSKKVSNKQGDKQISQLKIQKQNQKQKQKHGSNFRISRTKQENSWAIQTQSMLNQENLKNSNLKNDPTLNMISSPVASPFSKIKQSAFYELIGNKNKNTNHHCHHTFDGPNSHLFYKEHKSENQSLIRNANMTLQQSHHQCSKQSTFDSISKQTKPSANTLNQQRANNFSPIQILDQQSNSKSIKNANQIYNSNQIQACFDIKIQSQKQNVHQQLSVTDKYFRFYQKGRNQLIVNSMQLMLVRNQINNQVYRILPQEVAKTKLEQRLESINKCLAKNQKLVQLYADLIQSNGKENFKKGQIYSQNYDSVQQLKGICRYQQAVIEKLRKQLQYKTTNSSSSNSQINKNKQKIYSFIDQISLLRHEINRLYNQNKELNKLLNKLNNHPENSQLRSHNQSNIDYWNREQPFQDLERDSIKQDLQQYQLNYQNLESNQHNITFSDEKGSKPFQQQDFKQQNRSIFKIDTKFNQNFVSKEIQQSYSSVIIKQFKNSLKCRQIVSKHQIQQQSCYSPRKSKKQQTYSTSPNQLNSNNQNELYDHQTKMQQLEEEIYKFNIEKQYIQNELQKSLRQVQSLQRQNQLIRKELLSFKSSNQNTTSFYQNKISVYEDKIIKLEKQKMILSQKLQKLKQNSSDKQRGPLIKGQVYENKLNLQELFKFLKPHHQYYPILLNAVQAYQKKIAFLHQQTTKQKIIRAKIMNFLNQVISIFDPIQKYFSKLIKIPNFQGCTNPNILHAQISSKINDYQLLIDQIDQESATNSNKLEYYLMLIKSITIGISQKDIQTIQEQLFDYIKNLQSRLPTVNEMDDQESMSKSIRSQFE